jgi:cysteine desulfurase/selenocysteine lyase
MSEVEGLRLYGPDPTKGHHRAALVAFTHESVHSTDLATFLDQDGIAVRAGHHCTQPLHRELGIAGSCRASLYIYNTEAEVDAFIEALKSNLDMFAGLM